MGACGSTPPSGPSSTRPSPNPFLRHWALDRSQCKIFKCLAFLASSLVSVYTTTSLLSSINNVSVSLSIRTQAVAARCYILRSYQCSSSIPLKFHLLAKSLTNATRTTRNKGGALRQAAAGFLVIHLRQSDAQVWE
ncbi:unnamed protein product, partial [Cyprideis torosa]